MFIHKYCITEHTPQIDPTKFISVVSNSPVTRSDKVGRPTRFVPPRLQQQFHNRMMNLHRKYLELIYARPLHSASVFLDRCNLPVVKWIFSPPSSHSWHSTKAWAKLKVIREKYPNFGMTSLLFLRKLFAQRQYCARCANIAGKITRDLETWITLELCSYSPAPLAFKYHECLRNCNVDPEPRTCYFEFNLEHYMSKTRYGASRIQNPNVEIFFSSILTGHVDSAPRARWPNCWPTASAFWAMAWSVTLSP